MGQKFTEGPGVGINLNVGNYAVWGDSSSGCGVVGSSLDNSGVSGWSKNEEGVHGDGNVGVAGWGFTGVLAVAPADGGYGLYGSGADIGVYAENLLSYFRTGEAWPPKAAYLATRGLAADFYGDVAVHGHLKKSGGGFQIDHPLDPSAKYLNHSFVESAERKNVYDGVVILNARGEASIGLPEWLETLNRDFRYQLTPLGASTPDLHISQEIKRGIFKISGGKKGVRVCWQVTGVRRDKWAVANPLTVEERKTRREKDTYSHPEVFGRRAGQSVRTARYAPPVSLDIKNRSLQRLAPAASITKRPTKRRTRIARKRGR
jgi:hypothetical protein